MDGRLTASIESSYFASLLAANAQPMSPPNIEQQRGAAGAASKVGVQRSQTLPALPNRAAARSPTDEQEDDDLEGSIQSDSEALRAAIEAPLFPPIFLSGAQSYRTSGVYAEYDRLARSLLPRQERHKKSKTGSERFYTSAGTVESVVKHLIERQAPPNPNRKPFVSRFPRPTSRSEPSSPTRAPRPGRRPSKGGMRRSKSVESLQGDPTYQALAQELSWRLSQLPLSELLAYQPQTATAAKAHMAAVANTVATQEGGGLLARHPSHPSLAPHLAPTGPFLLAQPSALGSSASAPALLSEQQPAAGPSGAAPRQAGASPTRAMGSSVSAPVIGAHGEGRGARPHRHSPDGGASDEELPTSAFRASHGTLPAAAATGPGPGPGRRAEATRHSADSPSKGAPWAATMPLRWSRLAHAETKDWMLVPIRKRLARDKALADAMAGHGEALGPLPPPRPESPPGPPPGRVAAPLPAGGGSLSELFLRDLRRVRDLNPRAETRLLGKIGALEDESLAKGRQQAREAIQITFQVEDAVDGAGGAPKSPASPPPYPFHDPDVGPRRSLPPPPSVRPVFKDLGYRGHWLRDGPPPRRHTQGTGFTSAIEARLEQRRQAPIEPVPYPSLRLGPSGPYRVDAGPLSVFARGSNLPPAKLRAIAQAEADAAAARAASNSIPRLDLRKSSLAAEGELRRSEERVAASKVAEERGLPGTDGAEVGSDYEAQYPALSPKSRTSTVKAVGGRWNEEGGPDHPGGRLSARTQQTSIDGDLDFAEDGPAGSQLPALPEKRGHRPESTGGYSDDFD